MAEANEEMELKCLAHTIGNNKYQLMNLVLHGKVENEKRRERPQINYMDNNSSVTDSPYEEMFRTAKDQEKLNEERRPMMSLLSATITKYKSALSGEVLKFTLAERDTECMFLFRPLRDSKSQTTLRYEYETQSATDCTDMSQNKQSKINK